MFVSAANLRIVPERVLNAAGIAINFHDGPLPEYAGLNTPLWAILNGRSEHGITWHVMDASVDTGAILSAPSEAEVKAIKAQMLNVMCFDAGMAAFEELVAEISGPGLKLISQGGGVLNFRDLAQHLGDRPFYGLQARGIDGQFDPHTRIEEMAAEYVAAIRRVQPEGPYLLGGYSGGGVIAYEMAQQLLGAGEKVDMLVFIDTYYPHLNVVGEGEDTGRMSRWIRDLQSEGWGHVLRFAHERGRFESTRIRRLGAELYTALGWDLPIGLREVLMVQAFHDAAAVYEIDVYTGPIVMFSAEDRGRGSKHVPDDLGWTPFAVGGLRIHKIPGDHDNLVREPNIQRLAAVLQEELAAITSRADVTV